MKKCKNLLKKLFFLPPLPTLLVAIFGFGFVLTVAVFHIQNQIIAVASYVGSAYALTISITGFPHLSALIKRIKRYVINHSLTKRLHSTAIGQRYFGDVRFRTSISLYMGLLINLLYIAMKLYSGIRYHSTWFVALAVYYFLLAVMRLMIVRRVHVTDKTIELRRYRLCGFMLLFMNQALAGIVILIVQQNRGFSYPGLLIYAMAAYAFYMVITAIVNVVKTRRHDSPILSAAKAISLVAAMVSILSLTTAMISTFGGDDMVFRRSMTAAVGGGVCTVVILMAIFMIVRANRQLKLLNQMNGDTCSDGKKR